MSELISPEYLELLREMHRKAPWGTKGHKYYGEIVTFADRIGARSILDYGCGQATLGARFAVERPEIRVNSYDPAIEHKQKIGRADLVVSTDVFEHIEGNCIAGVIDDVAQFADKGILLVIALKLAKRTLPDGRNAHILVQPFDWWVKLLDRRLSDRWNIEYEKRKSLWVTATRR